MIDSGKGPEYDVEKLHWPVIMRDGGLVKGAASGQNTGLNSIL